MSESRPRNPRIPASSKAGRGTAGGRLRRTGRLAALAVIVLLAGVFGLTPAYADDPGLQCAAAATGSLAVSPDPMVFGQNATVQWSVGGPGCEGGGNDAVVITGSGFSGGELLGFSGSRTVFVTASRSVTFTVTVLDLTSDTGFSNTVVVRTVPIVGIITVPDVVDDLPTQAAQILTSAGYHAARGADIVDCNHLRTVARQDPAAGTSLPAGSTVTYRVGAPPKPPRSCG